jgi:hypothetical protein
MKKLIIMAIMMVLMMMILRILVIPMIPMIPMILVLQLVPTIRTTILRTMIVSWLTQCAEQERISDEIVESAWDSVDSDVSANQIDDSEFRPHVTRGNLADL